ncbi:hypothetical protein [Nostoc sp.]|uniref:hypothetical protein n=1 Tax=Nostoc sp. TaxID=1180 RepID=UPI002FFC6616
MFQECIYSPQFKEFLSQDFDNLPINQGLIKWHEETDKPEEFIEAIVSSPINRRFQVKKKDFIIAIYQYKINQYKIKKCSDLSYNDHCVFLNSYQKHFTIYPNLPSFRLLESNLDIEILNSLKNSMSENLIEKIFKRFQIF